MLEFGLFAEKEAEVRNKTLAQTVMERCDLLGSYSEEAHCLTRSFATPAMQQVNTHVAAWMRAAHMSVRQDQVGNLIGRYEADHIGAKTLLLGSHLDTVRDAGKYDGPLGVMIALACVERLHAQGLHLPFAIEVLGFADEEGLRYHVAYLGSRVMAGDFDRSMLALTDANEITMQEAIRSFGGDPDTLQQAQRSRDDLLGYCEVHIEQGPVLESLNLPVGVVAAIAGQRRSILVFEGQSGHAGTVPLALRQDALCAAAEFVLAVEQLARSSSGLIATVGQLSVEPGASNVIPGLVTLSLDIRHEQDILAEQADKQLRALAEGISIARQVAVRWQALQGNVTIACSSHLMQLWQRAIAIQQYPLHILPSGAGHDGVIMSQLTEIAMLFVRCKGGVSHHPAESVTTEDVEVAINVLDSFLTLVATEQQ